MSATSPNNARIESGFPVQFERWRFWRRWFGQRSERLAAKFLQKQGYLILARNIADTLGEIDLLLLTQDRQSLVVCEVRSTSSSDPQKAADSVNFVKQKKLSEATSRFLKRHRLLGSVTVRFDILAIAWPEGQPRPDILHLQDAFESTGRFQLFS
jgi:putative endonuclease